MPFWKNEQTSLPFTHRTTTRIMFVDDCTSSVPISSSQIVFDLNDERLPTYDEAMAMGPVHQQQNNLTRIVEIEEEEEVPLRRPPSRSSQRISYCECKAFQWQYYGLLAFLFLIMVLIIRVLRPKTH
ncbi:uncharacterized protein LOC129920480 [Episyrphus balteatus]|uniref:uncharacterized protein LOC129920480 n=1 Tax=Episyrphus balteatus TaxID=286459 RepID=UPI002485D8E2|nr:uncharacterized protein LOC129920480 [Episyrphus balteatus]XP_055857680.1 uncharacterized protein LOC129920480 [Episyrphus balteatus]